MDLLIIVNVRWIPLWLELFGVSILISIIKWIIQQLQTLDGSTMITNVEADPRFGPEFH